jgi:hypothetical protein
MNMSINRAVLIKLGDAYLSLEVVFFALEIWAAFKEPEKKITMIKLLRAYPGSTLSLREAKDLIEFVMVEGNYKVLVGLRQSQYEVVSH